MAAIKFIVSILFFIVIAAFAVLNLGSVPIFYYDLHFAKQSVEVALVLVVLVPFVMGFVLAWLFMVVNRVKLNMMIHKRNRTIASLNEELDRLQPHSHGSKVLDAQHRN